MRQKIALLDHLAFAKGHLRQLAVDLRHDIDGRERRHRAEAVDDDSDIAFADGRGFDRNSALRLFRLRFPRQKHPRQLVDAEYQQQDDENPRRRAPNALAAAALVPRLCLFRNHHSTDLTLKHKAQLGGASATSTDSIRTRNMIKKPGPRKKAILG